MLTDDVESDAGGRFAEDAIFADVGLDDGAVGGDFDLPAEAHTNVPSDSPADLVDDLFDDAGAASVTRSRSTAASDDIFSGGTSEHPRSSRSSADGFDHSPEGFSGGFDAFDADAAAVGRGEENERLKAVIRLRYADAEEIVMGIRDFPGVKMGAGNRVSVDPLTNTLIVEGSDEFVRQVQALARLVERPVPRSTKQRQRLSSYQQSRTTEARSNYSTEQQSPENLARMDAYNRSKRKFLNTPERIAASRARAAIRRARRPAPSSAIPRERTAFGRRFLRSRLPASAVCWNRLPATRVFACDPSPKAAQRKRRDCAPAIESSVSPRTTPGR